MGRQQRRETGSAISYNRLLVLQALSTGCRYGLEVMTVTELSAGTVYPILRRFEAEGLVSASREDEADAHADGRPARRLHRLTARGKSALAGAREDFLSRQRALGLLPPAY
jgi:DNA-binding PadR family transcriptional regulator